MNLLNNLFMLQMMWNRVFENKRGIFLEASQLDCDAVQTAIKFTSHHHPHLPPCARSLFAAADRVWPINQFTQQFGSCCCAARSLRQGERLAMA